MRCVNAKQLKSISVFPNCSLQCRGSSPGKCMKTTIMPHCTGMCKSWQHFFVLLSVLFTLGRCTMLHLCYLFHEIAVLGQALAIGDQVRTSSGKAELRFSVPNLTFQGRTSYGRAKIRLEVPKLMFSRPNKLWQYRIKVFCAKLNFSGPKQQWRCQNKACGAKNNVFKSEQALARPKNCFLCQT